MTTPEHSAAPSATRLNRRRFLGLSASAAASGAASNEPSPSPTEAGVPLEDLGTVPHLFFHSLVADPQRAFDGESTEGGYLDYMVTIPEFEACLEQLHERGYQLITPDKLFTVEESGAVSVKAPELTRGKKPLIMSFDDLSYYEYMAGDGFAKNVTVEDGELTCTYLTPEGKEVTGEYDYVPILERFIRDHPDFSHEGSKGVVALTGYNGILGYRTSEIVYGEENKNLKEDQRTARKVADAMKEAGWRFASHSWGHLNFTEQPVATLAEDTRKWKAEVEPLIGQTSLLIYPFGADISGTTPYGPGNAKYEMLKANGFSAFFNVDGSTPAWWQIQPDSIRANRINIDGISLKQAVEGRHAALPEFIDARSVLDPARPPQIAGNPNA